MTKSISLGDLTKSFSNHLAQTMCTKDAIQALRLLQSAGLYQKTPAQNGAASNVPAHHSKNDRIGIWERQKGLSDFVRSLESAEQWQWWANTPRIGPRQAKQRIVLIGESVARGYLYDPRFNPAKVLEAIFRSQAGPSEIEVVDLAKTGMTHKELKEVCESALLLNPDCVVIFAGNNWVLESIEKTDCDTITALAENGVPGLKRLAERRLAELSKDVIGGIVNCLTSHRVPLVWVLPEFNLGDWHDPITNAPYLSQGTNWKWIECHRKAIEALASCDYQAASARATELLQMDEGVCNAAFPILAQCAGKTGDIQQARAFAERARDALLERRLLTPRPHAVMQQVVRDEIGRASMQLVDLPKLFAEHLQGTLPDRRLFLDYCHLTAEGIQIAMTATASCVLRSLKRPALRAQIQNAKGMAPGSQTQAEAMFLAAVYNAHLHQDRALIEYFCRQARRSFPGIAEAMVCFATIQTQRSPMALCRATEQLANLFLPSVHKYLLRFSLHLHQLDKDLLDAMLATLQEIGVDRGSDLEQLRVEERAVINSKVNLADRYYCSSVRQEFAQPQASQETVEEYPSDYYKSLSPASKFIFLGKAGHPVLLELVCRLPALGVDAGDLSIELNGQFLGTFVISKSWQRHQVYLRQEAVQSGINEVILHWPAGEIPGKLGLDAAVEDMIAGFVPELYPVFGEVHFFLALDPATRSESLQYSFDPTLSLVTEDRRENFVAPV